MKWNLLIAYPVHQTLHFQYGHQFIRQGLKGNVCLPTVMVPFAKSTPTGSPKRYSTDCIGMHNYRQALIDG